MLHPYRIRTAALGLILALAALGPTAHVFAVRASLPQTAALELASHARALEKRGMLVEARDAWFQAGLAEPPGAAREDSVSRSRALDMRIALRRELCEGYPRDKGVLSELGVLDVTHDGVRDAERVVPWLEVPLDRLQRCSVALRVSVQARSGLVFESLARGSAREKEDALGVLAKMLEKKEIATNDAFPAVARARGEALPPSGYVFKAGRWSSVDQVAEAARSARIETLAAELQAARAADRDAAWHALLELGDGARARMAKGLEVRWRRAVELVLKGHALSQLAQVAEQRKELDRRREEALDLIFDEETYFYPYNPPECPAEKAKLYAGVQQRVDELVARVREVWKAEKRVQLPTHFREGLGEIEWCRARQVDVGVAFRAPEGWPEWLEAVDPALDVIDLATFAWNAAERAELARDRAVIAFDQRQYADGALADVARASTDEQHQVRFTNEYRQMLGRRVLAWNPKIQAAAQGHSDYMANTGDFGHDEADPERRWPGDRMRLEGYKHGGSENCAMSEGAEGAHVGWLHSSGHHRNILDATHTEMGSAAAGNYWTQNFGSGTEFLERLGAMTGQ